MEDQKPDEQVEQAGADASALAAGAAEGALDLVKRSKSSASRLLGMILNILDVSGMEDKSFVVDPQRIDLVKVARSSIDGAAAIGERQSVTVRLEGPDALEFVADASALGRVLDNLLLNALRYAPRDSDIEVSVGGTPEGARIEVTVPIRRIPPMMTMATIVANSNEV